MYTLLYLNLAAVAAFMPKEKAAHFFASEAPTRSTGLLQTERNHSLQRLYLKDPALVELMDELFSDAHRADTAGMLIVTSFIMAVAAAGLYFFLPREAKADSKDTEKGAEVSGSLTADEVEERAEAAMQDFESLAKTLAQSVAQKIGPKLAKGQAVRTILESRVHQFPDKAKTFLMNELNCAAGAVMKAIEAEEAMILLDLDNAFSLNFPPISMLLAGLVSPTLLNLSQSALHLQNVMVVLPMLLLCGWAGYVDYGTSCSVPTMIFWVKAQFGFAVFLGICNGMVANQISKGRAALDAKTERLQKRIKEAQKAGKAGNTVREMRELFVCNTVLIQEALLLEDEVKASFWFNASGIATVFWLVLMLWTFVLVFGWTFVPGQTAFDAAAAGSANFCGAWASVLVARIAAILDIFFLVINLLTVANWMATRLVASEGFVKAVSQKAREIDRKGLGFPVAELVVKALLLRGRSETLGAKLSIAEAEKSELEQEKSVLEAQLEQLQVQISARTAEVEAIKAQADEAKASGVGDPLGFQRGLQALETADVEELGSKWKEQGKKAVEDAQARAAAVTQKTTEELDRLLARFMELVQQVQDSQAFQSASSQLQTATEQTMASAQQLSAAAAPALQQGMASASQAAQQGMQTASQAVAQAKEAMS